MSDPFPLPHPPQHATPEPPKRAGNGVKAILAVIGGLIVLILLLAQCGGGGATPTDTTAPAPTAKAKTAKAKPPTPLTYRKITAREWKGIAKSPDSHAGQTVVVYGRVTQFDAVTGDQSFRADISGVRRTESYEYETNTVLTGVDASVVADLVEGDTFRANVLVGGSQKYETALGGETTVPALIVESVKILGTG